MPTSFSNTASEPGTRGSKDNKAKAANDKDLNFVDIVLSVGIRPLAEFLKGKKTAVGAIAALLAYATPLKDWASGSEFETILNLVIALLEFLAAWLGGGGFVSWLLTARRVGRLLI